jgi:hypothetical protein
VADPVTEALPAGLATLARLGACRGFDAVQAEVLFFSTDWWGRPPEATRRLCAGCRVKVECLAVSLALGPDLHGTWGGVAKRERERLLHYVRRGSCPACTSDALLTEPERQVCMSCGQSWSTVRPQRPAAPVEAA